MARRAADRTGQVYGKLTVIKRGPTIQWPSQKSTAWICRCECGRTRLVATINLRATKSCGKCITTPGKPTDECHKCKYYSKTSDTCDYILIEGKRRPCPPGKNCTAGVTGKYVNAPPRARTEGVA